MKSVAAIFFVLSLVLFSGCSGLQGLEKGTTTTFPGAEKAPAGSDFSLYFSQVISGDEYLLDTKAGTYKTHSCAQGSVQDVVVEMKLKEADLQMIRDSAQKNRIFLFRGTIR